jgi:peptidyl-dipeptidase Dcp
MNSDNPFARPSELPFALPPFALIRPEHFLPAFEAGMAEHRAEVEAIASSAEPPSVANTLDALERSGRLLNRASQVFFNLTSSCATEELNRLEVEIAPRLSAHHDAIYLDRRLFTRIAELTRNQENLGLDGERRRLLERYHKDFVRAGAGLDDDEQARLREINAEMARLTTEFKNDLLADTVEAAVHVSDRAELAGLSDGAIAAAAEAAKGRGLDGYLLTLSLPSAQPELESLSDRALRKRIHQASTSRGARGNDHDTRATLTRVVTLRAERARLLGYPDHATYVIEDETAKTVGAVEDMLAGLVPAAVANARAEATELEAALLADGETGPLQPWDWSYYAGKVREQKYHLDAATLRPYFELGRVVADGVFYAANQLYGLSFDRRDDLVAYHPDVQVYQVSNEDGTPRGLFLADWYTRDTKRGGAWMSTFVDQNLLLGDAPVVVINLNIARPPDGEPTLLTLDEVITAFHEFGHVLHGLLSDVRYPMLSGTNVPRDFVEFPSQVNEMWAYWPQVLARYAVHHVTGEPLAPDVVQALLAARSYGEGFATTEYLAAALLDLEWHRGDHALIAAGEPAQVEQFERDALARNGIEEGLIPPRYRSTYFAHVFAGGYSAGYYSYIWSEVLDADTVEWFTENGGLRRENGRIFASLVLSRGGAVDPMAAFEAFRGRAPRIEPLLARRGLALTI